MLQVGPELLHDEYSLVAVLAKPQQPRYSGFDALASVDMTVHNCSLTSIRQSLVDSTLMCKLRMALLAL
jgi:hypothetical protein